MRKTIGAGETSSDLEQEYHRYTYIQLILRRLQTYAARASKKPRVEYEVHNIVERWLLSLANFAKTDAIFADDVLDIDSRFNQQLIHEMIEKFAVPRAEFTEFFQDNILSLVREYKASAPRRANREYHLALATGKFQYGDYARIIAPERLRLLLDRGGRHAVARMLLRYACILPGAQHWNMPLASFRDYCAQGLTIEGFASPINAQMIVVDPANQFCSLFPDVDAPFGSIGRFFETDFVGRRTSVGPPYTVELFKRIADKVESQCEAAAASDREVLFYITFSAWEDTEGFQQILNSKWCYFAAILPA